MSPSHVFILVIFLYKNYSEIAKFEFPGVVDTGIWRNIPFPFSLVMDFSRTFLMNLQEGIQTVLYCAMSADLEGVSGKYYRDCKESSPHKEAFDENWQKVLWEKSVEIVKLAKDDPQI